MVPGWANLAGTSLCASVWVAASIAPHIGAHIESIDATRRCSRVDPRTLGRNTRLVRAPKMRRINSVGRRPIPVKWNSRRRQTAADFLLAPAAALRFASRHCHPAGPHSCSDGAQQKWEQTLPHSPAHRNPSATARSPTTQHLGWRPG